MHNQNHFAQIFEVLVIESVLYHTWLWGSPPWQVLCSVVIMPVVIRSAVVDQAAEHILDTAAVWKKVICHYHLIRWSFYSRVYLSYRRKGCFICILLNGVNICHIFMWLPGSIIMQVINLQKWQGFYFLLFYCLLSFSTLCESL